MTVVEAENVNHFMQYRSTYKSAQVTHRFGIDVGSLEMPPAALPSIPAGGKSCLCVEVMDVCFEYEGKLGTIGTVLSA